MLALCEKVEPSGISVHTPCPSFLAPYKKLYIGVSLCSGSMVLVSCLRLHAHVHACSFSRGKSLMLMVESLETETENKNFPRGNPSATVGFISFQFFFSPCSPPPFFKKKKTNFGIVLDFSF